MINIDFPANPSKLRFCLDNNFSTFYLLARAAKHYGPNNINVTYFHNLGPVNDGVPESTSNLHNLCAELGINCAHFVTARDFIPTSKHDWFDGLTTADFRDVLFNLLNTVDVEFTRDVFDSIFTTPNHVMYEITVLLDANIITPDLIPNTETNVDTIVSTTTASTTAYGNLLAKRGIQERVVGQSPAPLKAEQSEGILWAPLLNYTDGDILKSASEEGILDIVLMADSCDHDRPYHCGQCAGCLSRRILIIDQDIEDTTRYEY